MRLRNLLRRSRLGQPEGYSLIPHRTSLVTKIRGFSHRKLRKQWTQLPKTRFLVATLSTSAIFSGIAAIGISATNQSDAWIKVFANGAYVGLVPNEKSVTDSLARVAVGYHVNVSVSPIHTAVSSGYNWRRVESLPSSAIALEVAGKPLVYTATVADAHKVLSDIKAVLTPKHVTQGAEVAFVKPVALEKTTVGIADIWSAKAAEEHILHPGIMEPVGRSVTLDAIVPNRHAAFPQTRRNLNLTVRSGAAKVVKDRPVGLHTSNTPLLSVQVTETVPKTVEVPAPVHVEKTDTLGEGTQKVVASGKPGVAHERVALKFVNGKLDSSTVVEKRVVSSPVAEVVEQGTNTGLASGSWNWPSPYTDITSPFGWRILGGVQNFHPGVDIGCPIGTPVYASNNGVVEDAGWNNGGYGYWVMMNNGDGIETVYGHMSHVAVSAGETIAKGQVIGYSGDTGFVTGPHLHYEVRINGTAVDPSPYM